MSREISEAPKSGSEGPISGSEGPRTDAKEPKTGTTGPKTDTEGPKTDSEGPRKFELAFEWPKTDCKLSETVPGAQDRLGRAQNRL